MGGEMDLSQAKRMHHLHHFLHTNLGVGGVGMVAEKPLIKQVFGLSLNYRRKSQ